MARKVNQKTVNLIQEYEGYEKALSDGRCIAYLDTLPSPSLWSPGYRGLWTIGWGSTGPNITEGTVWTRAQATAALTNQINKKAAEVQAYVKYPLNDNQFGALVSLAYNIGTGGIHGILNLINQGNLEAAANSFPNYNHAGGRVVAGLTRRRYAEKELFEWEVPKEVAALSTPMQIAQNGQRATMLGGLTVAGILSFVQQAQTVVVNNAGWILLGGGIGLFGIFKLWEYHTQKAFDSGEYIPVGTKPISTPPPDPDEGTPIQTDPEITLNSTNDPTTDTTTDTGVVAP